MGALRHATADLVLGACCAGCGLPGHLVCGRCLGGLRPRPRVCWPDPTPAGLLEPMVTPVASGDYEGPLRAVLLQFKEHRRVRLLPLLARYLGSAVERVGISGVAVTLVPMPSRRSVVRARGYDAVALIARRAAHDLRRRGLDVRVSRCLTHRTRVADQAGLTTAERQANLAGSLGVVGRVQPGRAIIVVDDVITTGASMAEAVGCLRRAGADPIAVATVCATRKQIRRLP